MYQWQYTHKECRRKTLALSPEIILEWMKLMTNNVLNLGDCTAKVIRDAIPQDAVCCQCWIDHSGNVRLMLESRSFDLIAAGASIPPLSPALEYRR